ncbi:glycosyltransferase [Streptomyces sp. BI20]|uniref:glycosyltransferase n=1 Tax=Streptomyces sp. BI20 TaxID=3403460 RepID=UPI003C74E474
MTVLAWVSLLVWLWLVLFRGGFWRTDVRLPPGGSGPPAGGWPAVAVVVPARDEAGVLPLSLPSLLAQRYPGEAGIVFVDDDSGDGTGDLARELAARSGGLPLVVVSPGAPAPGWTGKLWAVRHGMEVAGRGVPGAGGPGSRPRWLLLTDADIAHGPDSLRDLVAAGEAGGLDLVSLMARLRVVTAWEALIVPAFVFFFAQLYPFRWVRRVGGRTAAAAGGCVLLRAEAAARADVPGAIRHAVIDDVALARAMKGSGGRIWLGLAQDVESVRPYPRLADLWAMVARSAYTQLRLRPELLVGTVLGLVLVYLVPPVAVVVGVWRGDGVLCAVGAVAWGLMAGCFVPMVRHHRASLVVVPLLPGVALLYLLMTVDSAVRHHRGRGAAWKGRTYAGPGAGRSGEGAGSGVI